MSAICNAFGHEPSLHERKELPRGTRVIANTRGVILHISDKIKKVAGERARNGKRPEGGFYRFDLPISAAIAFRNHNGLK